LICNKEHFKDTSMYGQVTCKVAVGQTRVAVIVPYVLLGHSDYSTLYFCHQKLCSAMSGKSQIHNIV